MKTNNIDIDVTAASAFVDLTTQDEPCEIDEQPDPLAKFAESAQLAGALGRRGWETVEGLREEMRETDARLANLDKTRAAVETRFAKNSAEDLDAELGDGGALEKGMSSSARRRDSLKGWMVGEIRKGETASGLIAFARAGGDSDTARLLASIAEEL